MRFRIIVGLGLSCLMDIAYGIFFAWFISKIMSHPISIWTYGFGICLALSPDLDVLFQKKEINSEHRDIGLHYPIIIVFIFLFSFISFFWTLLASFCLLAHFVHDSIGEGPGLKWLWPFSQRHYKFFEKANGKRNFIRSLTPDEVKQMSLPLKEWIETFYLRPTAQVFSGIIAFVLAIILVLLF